MSKKSKLDFESKIISQIKSDKIKMKPKWYFVLGSLLMFTSLIGLSMGAVFLVNLGIFLIRRNGPLNTWKLQSILSTFPWWILLVAIGGIYLAIRLLKKYDLSYQKNFKLIIVMFVLAIFSAGLLLDGLGLNEYLSQGKMRKYYQQFDKREQNKFLKEGCEQNVKQMDRILMIKTRG
jgi:hypothetical protein